MLKIMNKLEELKGILLGLVAGLAAVASIMLLLLLVMFLYAIAGLVLFGENDPFHFGGVGRAMLTLFQVATLAGWTDIYRINYFGCDRHEGGVYQAGPPSRVHTALGSYDRALCHAPAAAPISATVFFFTFTVLTAFVVLSLFISVITSAMFEAMESHKHQKQMARVMRDSSASEKRERLLAALNEAGGLPDENLAYFFAREDAMDPDNAQTDPLLERIVSKCDKLAKSTAFGTVIILAIVAIAVLEICSVEGMGDRRARALASHTILGIFTLEIVVKVVAEGSKPWKYFSDNWVGGALSSCQESARSY